MRAHTVRCCKSINYQAIEGFARQSHHFFFEKKNSHWPIEKSKNRQEVRKKRRFLQEYATGELERLAKDKRAALFSVQQNVTHKAGLWSGCPDSNSGPNNTIGLLNSVRWCCEGGAKREKESFPRSEFTPGCIWTYWMLVDRQMQQILHEVLKVQII